MTPLLMAFLEDLNMPGQYKFPPKSPFLEGRQSDVFSKRHRVFFIFLSCHFFCLLENKEIKYFFHIFLYTVTSTVQHHHMTGVAVIRDTDW